MFTASTPEGFIIAVFIALALLIELLLENILIPEIADFAVWKRFDLTREDLITYDFRKPAIVVVMAILTVALVAGLDLNFIELYAESYGTYADVLLNAGGLMGLASGLHLALRGQQTVYSLPGVLDAIIETVELEGGDDEDTAAPAQG